MNKLSVINKVKYNRLIVLIYNFMGSKLVSFMKLFLRPDKRLIVFASFGGRKYDDSPKVIYEAMLTDHRFHGYKFVWAFINPEYFDIPRGEKVKTDTLSYYKILLRARAWVTNSSMTRGLNITGINTFELNTWHGSAIKRMGSDITEGNKSFGLKKETRNKSLMLAQGQFDVDVFSRAFHRPEKDFRIIGLPRNDVLIQTTQEDRMKIKSKLSIDRGKTVILYAPTFREYEKDGSNNCVSAPPMDLKRWRELLGDHYVVLFRAHYEVVNVMGIEDNDFVKNVSDYPILDELMIASDMLISDYSSIFFDYALMGKPMLCFTYDYDRYERERGMYFDIRSYLPHAENEEELLSLIKSTDINMPNKATIAFQKKFVTAYGSAAMKALDIIYESI